MTDLYFVHWLNPVAMSTILNILHHLKICITQFYLLVIVWILVWIVW